MVSRNITISTTVRQDILEAIKAKGIKVNSVIYYGWANMQGFPAITQRMNTLEAENAELMARNEKLFLVTQRMRREVDTMLESVAKVKQNGTRT